MPAALEISLLGPPRVLRAGRTVSFETRKATALLAHLALAARPRSREALCALLWSEQDPEHARGALRRTLSALRKSIGEDWIETAGDSVALRDGGGLSVDVRRFRALTSERASTEQLAEAAALFRGDLLEGFSLRDNGEFDAWYAFEADALERELSTTLGRLVGLLAARRDYAAAIAHARRWVALDPLHEPAHRELIRLHALNGDRAAALAQYRNCVRTLNEELGVPPLEDTVALFEQISEGTLAPPAPAPAASSPSPVAPAGELPLVARTADLQALVEARRAATPDGRLALIEGEAGIGKTRLARELAAEARAAGATVLEARCHEDEAFVAYGPVVELLRAAARAGGGSLPERAGPQQVADASLLVPELAALRDDLPPAVGVGDPGARTRLLEGVAAVLGSTGGPTPALLVVDDVHGADEATVDVLAYLARRLQGRPLLLVLTFRGERVPPGHRLRRLAGETIGTVVRLGRLGEADVAELVRSAGVAPRFARRVFRESEGLPLLVAEYLAAIARGLDDLPLGEVRELLEMRLHGLGGTARQVLEAGAVIGRSFDVAVVRSASGRSDEELADGLEELVAHGLVREHAAADGGYEFTHDKLRAVAYDGIGGARRRLLHERVADALRRSPQGDVGASVIAQHLRLSGDRVGAAAQHRRAARHSASVLAYADALAHLDAALELGAADAAAVHEEMGDLRTRVGDYAGALASYEAAAAVCEPAELARVEHKLGGIHQRRGEWERAETRFALALEALQGDDALKARIIADLSLTMHRAGRPESAAELAAEAGALAEVADDDRARAQAHNLLGVLARTRGRYDQARGELNQSLALAERLGDASARAAALNNLALVAREAGEPERALELTEAALAVCAAHGDRHREAALENNLADLHHEAGRADEAMIHLKRAVAIFSAVGGDERTRLPEVWKLVSW